MTDKERATEKASRIIRWLRPEFQNPGGSGRAPEARQGSLISDEPEADTSTTAEPVKKQPWPKTLPEQAQAVRAILASSPIALNPAAVAKQFVRGQSGRVGDLLDTLVSLGQARAMPDGTHVRS